MSHTSTTPAPLPELLDDADAAVSAAEASLATTEARVALLGAVLARLRGAARSVGISVASPGAPPPIDDVTRARAVRSLGAEAPDSVYYDQSSNPLGKRRYLDLARAGAFPSSKVGKRVLAKRSDVDGYIASHAVRGRAAEQPPPEDDEGAADVLARIGLRLRGGR